VCLKLLLEVTDTIGSLISGLGIDLIDEARAVHGYTPINHAAGMGLIVTSRGGVVVAGLDWGLNDSKEGDLVLGGIKEILDAPVEGILGGLRGADCEDNVNHSDGSRRQSI
jgi:hypothetical protein